MICAKLSFDRLALMAQDFFHTNCRKQSGTRLFLKHCQRALSQNIIPDLPRSLLQILSVEFKLSVEGISNVLSHQELFPDWCSNDPADKWFGARKCALEEDFSGYFNCINETKEFTEQLLARLFQALDSQRPTRAVIVAPLTFLSGHKHTLLLPLCSLNWDRELSQEHSPKLSVVLALNKESMLIDPIFWTAFCVKLREWSHQNRVPATIPERTDWLFKERRNPDRQARMVTIPLPEIETTPYPFFMPYALGSLNLGNDVSIERKLFSKIERHPPLAALLGILPNQLRELLKKQKMKNREEALTDLSLSMFWQGYMIWKRRKHLMSAFYKRSAPDEWKREYKEKKSRKRKKLKTCKNPFHYLERWCDLSGQLKSRCACSDSKAVKKQTQSMDIRKFFQIPKLNTIAFGPTKWVVEKNISAPSRSDLIKQSHDRGKKRKGRRSHDM